MYLCLSLIICRYIFHNLLLILNLFNFIFCLDDELDEDEEMGDEDEDEDEEGAKVEEVDDDDE